MILSIDHIVLTVKDLKQSIEFYTDVLGLSLVTFGENRKALTFGQQKINLHQYGQEFEPKAAVQLPGSVDLCFITERSIEEVQQQLISNGIEIIDGPVTRTGALGPITSIYIRDPDGNLIELSNYV